MKVPGRRNALAALALAASALASACIPSNVVAEEDRAVAIPAAQLVWDAPVPDRLAGLYESVRIEGAIAQGMRQVWYWFEPSGAFTGAALVQQEAGPRFETLAGSYRIAGGRLWLGDSEEPALLSAAPGYLRLASTDGTIVLRGVE
jgi:hypothetical protein